MIKLKTVLALLLLGVAGLLLYKVTPPYFANMQLADEMRNEARFAQANNRTPNDVRGNILREARRLEIPLNANDIQVQMRANETRITADYTITIDLYYTKVEWDFHLDSSL